MQETESVRSYRYDAFISYRHLPFDKEVAQRLQKLLESYKPPKGALLKNMPRIQRIFRDESELPTSSNLGANIKEALDQSRFLIVVCSEETRRSEWCLEEIRYFKSIHDNTNQNILTLVIGGEPRSVFPEALCEEERTIVLDNGQHRVLTLKVEPLAANIVARSRQMSLKKLKTEFLRLAAPILGCTYDELLRRHQRRAVRNIVSLAGVISSVILFFSGFALYQSLLIDKSNKALSKANQALTQQKEIAVSNEIKAVSQRDRALLNQSLYLADLSRQQLAEGDKMMAIMLALEALPKDLKNPEKPLVNEAWGALFSAVYDKSMAHASLTHLNAVQWTAFSQDGKLAATASDDRTVKLWLVHTGQLLQTFSGHTAEVYRASFLPDGRIVTVSADNTMRLWSTETGTEVSKMDINGWLFLGFSPDGALGAFRDAKNQLVLINTADMQKRLTISHDLSSTHTLVISPDKQWGVALSGSLSPLVYNLISGEEVATLKGHTANIISASFSSDSKTILTASEDTTARAWNAADGRCLFVLKGHSGRVNAANMSPDGKWIVTASDDKTARLYDAATGKETGRLETFEGPVKDARFTPDSQSIVISSEDKRVSLWDVQTCTLKARLTAYTPYGGRCWLSPDSRFIATLGFGDAYVRLWDMTSEGFRPLTITMKGIPSTFSLSADGCRAAMATAEKQAYVIDRKTLKMISRLQGFSDTVDKTVFSPDGLRLAVLCSDGSASLWDAVKGKKLFDLSDEALKVKKAVFSSNGALLALLSPEGVLTVRDAATNNLVFEAGAQITDMAFTPDSKRLLAIDAQYQGILWDCEKKRAEAKLKGHTGPIRQVDFSPDSLQVVTASDDQTARIWSTKNGTCLLTLQGHSGGLTAAHFDKDGRKVVTASLDETARLWDARNGKPLAVFSGTFSPLMEAQFSKDNTRLFVVSEQGRVVLYDVNSGNMLTTLNSGFRLDPVKLYQWQDEAVVLDLGVNKKINLDNGDMDFYLHSWTLNVQELISGANELLNGRTLTDEERQKFYISR
ncbi:MAG: TIR domain-containing protein [Clostridia bacterium]|nr:TIR domain-containing protein [Clostridia bacterium]